jgi:hypothetical protein
MNKLQAELFFKKLEGKEGCNFQEKEKGNPESITWTCKGGNDQSFAIKILKKMGIPDKEITDFLSECHEFGGHCDCEILFNAEDDIMAKYED